MHCKKHVLCLTLLACLVLFGHALALGPNSMAYDDVDVLEPGPGDLPAEQALSIAREAFLEVPGITSEIIDDMEVYQVFYTVRDREPEVRGWFVRFSGREGSHLPDFPVDITSPEGDILFITEADHYLAGIEDIASWDLRDTQLALWEAEKGNYHTWTLEDKIDFAVAYEKHDGVRPSAGDLSQEEAVRIARAALLSETSLTEASLGALVEDIFFQTSLFSDTGTEWYISYYDPDTNEQLYVVWIQAQTGQVLDLIDAEQSQG